MKTFNLVRRWKNWRIGRRNAKTTRHLCVLQAALHRKCGRVQKINFRRSGKSEMAFYEDECLKGDIAKLDTEIIRNILKIEEFEK